MRRNGFTPISLLPPEVLARVFHFLVLEDPPCSPEQDRGWMRATQVCRFWRQVAQGDSSLWATISWKLDPTNTELISEMLYRSRDAPLDIDLDFGFGLGFGFDFDIYGPQCREVLLMFPPHLPRIRKIRLYNLPMSHFDIFQRIYGREAPALEHFELGFSITSDSESPVVFQDLGDTTLFEGRAPRLRTLSLSHILVKWSRIPLVQLTQLKIAPYEEVSTNYISPAVEFGDLTQFIDLLVNCPGLETLALEHCLPSQLAQLSHGQTIHLSCLSRLCLGGPSSRIMNLMKMLDLPSLTTLHLHCISEDSFTHDDHLLLPIVSAKLKSPAPVEFQKLSVTLTLKRSASFTVTASTTLPSSRSRQSEDIEADMDGDAEFILSFDGLGNFSDLLKGVCKMLSISNLKFLSISSYYFGDTVNWAELFEGCTEVTTLQIIGLGASSFVWALTAPEATNANPNKEGKQKRTDNRDSTLAQPAGSTASRADAHIFPKLMFLSLKGLDFAEEYAPAGILFDVVKRGFLQRKVAYNEPLKMLRIDNCTIIAWRAEALQKLVQEFHWDKFQGPDYDGNI
jgi:F-box-like